MTFASSWNPTRVGPHLAGNNTPLRRLLHQQKAQTVKQIQEIVTLEAAAMAPSKVIGATENFRRRVELCRIKTGGHFEAEIKKLKM